MVFSEMGRAWVFGYEYLCSLFYVGGCEFEYGCLISSRPAELRAHCAASIRRKICHIGKDRGSLLGKGVCEVSYASTSPRWNRRLLRQRVARPTCVCGGSRDSALAEGPFLMNSMSVPK